MKRANGGRREVPFEIHDVCFYALNNRSGVSLTSYPYLLPWSEKPAQVRQRQARPGLQELPGPLDTAQDHVLVSLACQGDERPHRDDRADHAEEYGGSSFCRGAVLDS